MRLFAAICLPESAKQQLIQLQGILRQYGEGNFTTPDNLHLTLAFLGETGNVRGAARAVTSLRHKSFPITIASTGAFGSLQWAGVQLSRELANLRGDLADSLRKEGFVLEARPFSPHLTLCRQFRPARSLDRQYLAQALGEVTFSAHTVELMRSDRLRGKPVYTSIATCRLLESL